jgi:hypothetical protein
MESIHPARVMRRRTGRHHPRDGAVQRPDLAVTSAPTIQTEGARPSAAAAPRVRLIAARVLVVVATLLAAVSVVAGYVRYQALDTPTVENAAGELISDDAIRTQIAAQLVDELYASVDVATAPQQRLPPDQQRLAALLDGALRELTDRAAVRLLERPRVHDAWLRPRHRRTRSCCGSSTIARARFARRTATSCSTCARSSFSSATRLRSSATSRSACRRMPDASS